MKRALIWLILILGTVVFLYPFLWMVSATFKPEMEIPSFSLLPSSITLASYKQVFAKIPILRALLTSLIVSISITASVLFFGSMVGYALSRLRFRGRELMVMVILFTMMIPFQLTMIPLYILMVKLHWTDTYLALIVPGMMSGFGILLFRQFFKSVPRRSSTRRAWMVSMTCDTLPDHLASLQACSDHGGDHHLHEHLE